MHNIKQAEMRHLSVELCLSPTLTQCCQASKHKETSDASANVQCTMYMDFINNATQKKIKYSINSIKC